MPTGFHPNPHFFSAHLELTVELLRFLAVPQFPLVPFTTVRIDKRNLLEARVIVTTYNDHVRLLSPEPWLASATKVYSGVGADIVMESLRSLILIASCRGRGGWRTLRRFRRWEARMFRSPRLLYLLSLAFKFTSAPGRILISRSQSA